MRSYRGEQGSNNDHNLLVLSGSQLLWGCNWSIPLRFYPNPPPLLLLLLLLYLQHLLLNSPLFNSYHLILANIILILVHLLTILLLLFKILPLSNLLIPRSPPTNLHLFDFLSHLHSHLIYFLTIWIVSLFLFPSSIYNYVYTSPCLISWETNKSHLACSSTSFGS